MTDSTTVTAGEQTITIDRRSVDRRGSATETREARGRSNEQGQATKGQPQRRKQNRRRQIDPTTCERDYSEQEIEFMRAMDDYKRAAGRMFPTCSEVLEVVRSLGYVQLSDEQRSTLLGDDAEPVAVYTGEAEASDEDWDSDEL